MFVGRTGRTISKTSNIDDLYQSIYSVILRLPHETIIYPGHNYGYQKTISLKQNILISKFFQCKSIDNFKKVMLNFESNFKKNKKKFDFNKKLLVFRREINIIAYYYLYKSKF